MGQGQSGRECEQAGSALALLQASCAGPLPEARGQDETASALAHLPLKVTATPAPLLSLCLGASPAEDPAGPSPGPMRNSGLQGVCQEEEQIRALCTVGGEEPCQNLGGCGSHL